MKKQFLLLLSIAAVSALAACNINVKPSSSSFAPVESSSENSSEEESSSSEEESSSSESSSDSSDYSSDSSSSSSSSSSEEDIGPVPSEVVIPSDNGGTSYPADKPYSDYLLLNYSNVSLTLGNEKDGSVQLRGLPRPLQPANNLSFRSLDSAIASVDASGKVTAVGQGQTSIEVSDKDHPDVKKLVPVNVFGNLVPAIPEVEGEHYTEEEAAAYNAEHGLSEGDEGYVTTEDWKVEPIPEVPNDKEKIAQITDDLAVTVNGVHFTQEEIDAAQPGDPAYGKKTKDYKVLPEKDSLTEIVDHELREMSTWKNGQRQIYNVWDETLIASKDEAYFRITETDGDIVTEDGAMTFEDSEWIFNTNKYYDTYVFHTLHGVKNYYPVSTVNYMPSDPNVNERYVPMYEILDNLFTSGHDIFTNTLENATMADCVDIASKSYTNVVKNCVGGFLDADGNPTSTKDLFFDCVLDFADQTADQDDETQSGIPYGTPTPATQRMMYTVKDGKLVHYRIELVMDYSFGGDDYQKIYLIDHSYERFTAENRDSLLFIPDASQYTLVDYLFAI